MAIQNVTGGAERIAGIGQNAVDRIERNTGQNQNTAPAAESAPAVGADSGPPPQNRIDQAATAQTTPPQNPQGLQAPGVPLAQLQTNAQEPARVERNTGNVLSEIAGEQVEEPLPQTARTGIVELPAPNRGNESAERVETAQIEGQEEANALSAIAQNAGGPGVVQEFQRTAQPPAIGEHIDITA